VGQKTRKKTMEISDIGIDQCIKDHLVNLQCRAGFCKYFPEEVTDKCK
jgi:hypothetical protein